MPYKDNADKKRAQTEFRNKRKALAIAHLGGKCSCGSSNGLEFHHRDKTTKSFAIGKSFNKTMEELFVELDKCDLLCERCHKNIHSAPHGSARRFDYGCRCDPCRSAKSTKGKRWRERARLRAISSTG